MEHKRIRDYGITVGKLPTGMLNKISDVKGVRVGHCTITAPEHQTGVTVVMPTSENIFLNKLISASFVLNGYGKTLGLIQIDELGTLESPIALTNTLNVGIVHDALVSYLCGLCEKDAFRLTSVNPVVCECNDSALNNITERAVSIDHVLRAIAAASEDFEEGAVGGGRGMTCYGWKGGIGSASRLITLDGNEYAVGVLVQTNHGKPEDFIINGMHPENSALDYSDVPDKGSIIIILATDLPVSSRQLKRIIKRTAVGIIRTGSYIGHGSGEIAIGFSTANLIKENEENDILPLRIINEAKIDLAFRAAAEAAEEAILNSLVTAETVTGCSGLKRYGFRPECIL